TPFLPSATNAPKAIVASRMNVPAIGYNQAYRTNTDWDFEVTVIFQPPRRMMSNAGFAAASRRLTVGRPFKAGTLRPRREAAPRQRRFGDRTFLVATIKRVGCV